MTRHILVSVTCLVVLSGGCRHQEYVYRDGQRGVYHTVERHQTFWRICKTYGVDMAEVARINGIRDKSTIQLGQRIFITGAAKVLKVDIYVEDVTARENSAAVRYEKGKFMWPVQGTITAHFGTDGKRNHDGIDISLPSGQRIAAEWPTAMIT